MPSFADVTRLLGQDAGEATAAAVHEQSAGSPLLVDVVTRLLDGPPDRLLPPAPPLPPAVVERWRHLVDGVPGDARLVLEAAAVGADPETGHLAAVTGLPAARLVAAVEAARATGHLDGHGRVAPFVRALLLGAAPVLRLQEMQRALIAAGLDRRGPLLPLARRMLGSGASGTAAVAVFEAAADEALPRSPATAAELFGGAVTAGGDPATTAARRSSAVALAGDLDSALRLADTVMADPEVDADDRTLATATAAAVLAHRGFPDRSSALTAALPDGHPTGPVWAVPGLLAVGDAAGARQALAAANPTECRGLGHQAGVLVASALLAAVDGDPQRGLAGLARAAVLLEPVAATTLLPDTPAALTALLALQTGEAGVADVALRRAAAGHHGGTGAQLRHLLLHGWVLLVRGRFRVAQEALDRSATRDASNPATSCSRRLSRWRWPDAAGASPRSPQPGAGPGSPCWTIPWTSTRSSHSASSPSRPRCCTTTRTSRPPLTTHKRCWVRSASPWRGPRPCSGPGPRLRWSPGGAPRPSATSRLSTGRRAAPTRVRWPPRPVPGCTLRWGVVDQEAAIDAARGLAAVGLPWEGAKLAGQAAAHSNERGAVRCAARLRPRAVPFHGRQRRRATAGSDRPGDR